MTPVPRSHAISHRQILTVCLPLMMSSAAVTVMEFTDRIFLTHYSVEAISAATPAGVTALLFIAFFSGVTGYAGVFIAQYTGAGADRRVGGVLWQALYFSILSGLCFLALAGLAGPIFRLGGHSPDVQRLEIVYFRILCLGAVLHVAEIGLAGFFTGRGLTRPVMIVNILGMALNIPLDYALINGFGPFPELGIAGAGLATVAAWLFMLLLYTVLIFRPGNDRRFAVWSARRWDTALFGRLMRYGIPGSLQFCLDICAFLFFIFMVGRIGKPALAATNIVITVNALAFLPALGFSQGVSMLVGQALGRGDPDRARMAVRKAIQLLLGFIVLVDLLYLLAPEQVIGLFVPGGMPGTGYATILATAVRLLRVVAIYIFMDALYMIFAGALRGAGDTRFVMWSIGLASVVVMIGPTYLVVEVLKLDLMAAWICVLLFITCLFAICGLRYRQGRWQSMRVVEAEVLSP